MFKNKKYINSVNAEGIFDNTYDTKLPQTIINKIILKHFESAEKKPKCLFIGWDGCRADAMKYLLKSNNEKISGHNVTSLFSAVSSIKENGGLYITYVGGDKHCRQETSTAQGWSCALCGKWLKKSWRMGIDWSLDNDYPTIHKTLSLKGFKTSFSAEWPIHFDNTYLNEIEFAEKNNLPQYFYKFETDTELYNHFIERIKSDDDLIFGIYENPDHNGHSTGFGDNNYRYVAGICNLDRFSYIMLNEIKSRSTFDEEDWLVLIASDHGGISNRHGGQRAEERTTFLAVSKPIEAFNI